MGCDCTQSFVHESHRYRRNPPSDLDSVRADSIGSRALPTGQRAGQANDHFNNRELLDSENYTFEVFWRVQAHLNSLQRGRQNAVPIRAREADPDAANINPEPDP